MIYFNSDYLEGAHPALMAKLNETNMVQTVGYGEDEYCAAAREKIKAACQAPDADVHFLVGGTLTNTTVIASVLRPYQGVLTAASGHINCHETGAIESSGHKVLALPTNNGKITAQQVEDYYNWHHFSPDYEHMVMPGMVYISFPTEGGTMYSKAELTALYEVCRKCGLPLFIDGARMGYGLTCDDCDLTLPELAQRMAELGCDIAKIAVMPQTPRDVLTLLSATEQMHTSHPEIPIITMSMGQLGLVSRLCGEVFGSALTFGAAGQASAPGQAPVQALRQVLNLLHGTE